MYHIVICDDEPIFLTQISEMIIDILASMGESCEIRKYTSISELKNTNFRLITFLIYNSKKADKLSMYFKTCLRN